MGGFDCMCFTDMLSSVNTTTYCQGLLKKRSTRSGRVVKKTAKSARASDRAPDTASKSVPDSASDSASDTVSNLASDRAPNTASNSASDRTSDTDSKSDGNKPICHICRAPAFKFNAITISDSHVCIRHIRAVM